MSEIDPPFYAPIDELYRPATVTEEATDDLDTSPPDPSDLPTHYLVSEPPKASVWSACGLRTLYRPFRLLYEGKAKVMSFKNTQIFLLDTKAHGPKAVAKRVSVTNTLADSTRVTKPSEWVPFRVLGYDRYATIDIHLISRTEQHHIQFGKVFEWILSGTDKITIDQELAKFRISLHSSEKRGEKLDWFHCIVIIFPDEKEAKAFVSFISRNCHADRSNEEFGSWKCPMEETNRRRLKKYVDDRVDAEKKTFNEQLKEKENQLEALRLRCQQAEQDFLTQCKENSQLRLEMQALKLENEGLRREANNNRAPAAARHLIYWANGVWRQESLR